MQSVARRYFAAKEAGRRRGMIAFMNATLVVQKCWRKALFERKRRLSSTKLQTQYRRWVACRKYVLLQTVTKKVQTCWRCHAKRNYYRQILRNIILIQASMRRWYQGAVKVSRRKAALQMLQNHARIWLAVRTLEASRQRRKLMNEKAIVCQVSGRKECHLLSSFCF